MLPTGRTSRWPVRPVGHHRFVHPTSPAVDGYIRLVCLLWQWGYDTNEPFNDYTGNPHTGAVIVAGTTRQWWARLSRGGPLPEAEWRSRHRLIVTVLACHVPALFAAGLFIGQRLILTLGQLSVIVLLVILAAIPGGLARRSLAATVGLLTCSAVLVAMSNGMSEAHFYFFVMLIFVALYQDWRPFVAAFLYVLLEQILVGTLLFQRGYSGVGSGGAEPAVLALVHGAFIAATGAVLVVFWGWSARSYAREESYRLQLMDAEMGAIARMREAGQMREDLMTSVSHEFRTPLTAIRGVVATLRSQGERITPEVRDSLLAGIAEHEGRLSRLLEDMLAAASASMTDPTAAADVSAVLQEAAEQSRVNAISTPGLMAAISPATLEQVVAAMIRHGRDYARDGGPMHVEGRAEDGDAVVGLRYETNASTAECPDRLLEPFGSRECAETGRPNSLDLYLARRLAEVHDGRMEAAVEGDTVTIIARFRRLAAMPPDPPGAPDDPNEQVLVLPDTLQRADAAPLA